MSDLEERPGWDRETEDVFAEAFTDALRSPGQYAANMVRISEGVTLDGTWTVPEVKAAIDAGLEAIRGME